MAEALARISWEIVSGKTTSEEQHNPIKNAAVIGISGGEKTFVEPVTP